MVCKRIQFVLSHVIAFNLSSYLGVHVYDRGHLWRSEGFRSPRPEVTCGFESLDLDAGS